MGEISKNSDEYFKNKTYGGNNGFNNSLGKKEKAFKNFNVMRVESGDSKYRNSIGNKCRDSTGKSDFGI